MLGHYFLIVWDTAVLVPVKLPVPPYATVWNNTKGINIISSELYNIHILTPFLIEDKGVSVIVGDKESKNNNNMVN